MAAPNTAHDANPRMGLARTLFLFSVLTASSDLFLVWNVAGFTLRAHQVLMIFPLAYVLGVTVSSKKIRLPIGALPLYAWMVFIIAFVPNTVFLSRSIGYAVWLLIDVSAIFLAVQLFDDLRSLEILLKWYVRTFLAISIVGLMQLVLGLCHLPAPYARMLPRINGLSYEPSYYATYLMMGWVLCAWMIEKGSYFVPQNLVRVTFISSTLALVLSTSRLGWMLMALWGCGYFVRRVMRWKPVTLGLGSWLLVVNLFAASLAGFVVVATHESDNILRSFAAGLGVFGAPSHSVDERMQHMWMTLELVQKNPFMGTSLGGIAPAIREQQHETAIRSNLDTKPYEGNSIFVEALAASGVIGFLPFVAYVLMLLIKPSLLASACPEPLRTVLSGLVLALGMELLALQFSPNILRPYLWFHIAIVSAAYATIHASRRPAPRTVETRVS